MKKISMDRVAMWILPLALLSVSGCIAPSAIANGGNIFEAIKARNTGAAIQMLSENPQYVNGRDRGASTPLHWAALYDLTDVVQALIKSNAEIDSRSDNGSTPLHWAARKDNAKVITSLLRYGANIEATTEKGYTPLHWAAMGNGRSSTEALIGSGANLDAKAEDGSTPLHWAVREGGWEVVKLLVMSGAAPSVSANNGTTPESWTKSNEDRNIFKSLVAQRSAKTPVSFTQTQLPSEKTYSKSTDAASSNRSNPDASTGPTVSQKWALIIGISAYQDKDITPLQYAEKDATAFYGWCISPNGGGYTPSHVTLLTNENATGRRIRKELFTGLERAIEEDVVTIFFAGHGQPSSPDPESNLFFLPYDAEYASIASTGFPMWDIKTALERFIKAKKVFVITDACHSGGVGSEFDVARRSGRGLKVNRVASELSSLSKIGDGTCIISASDDNQLSQESERWGGGHGVFTYFLLEGLKGEADLNSDGTVTIGELTPYVSEQVRRATKSHQCPRTAGNFDPAMTLGN